MKNNDKEKEFIAEDNLTYALLLFFKAPKKKTDKSDNLSKVNKAMEASKNNFNKIQVALIDDDKKTHQTPYLNEFEKVKQEDDLILKQSKENPNQKVILMQPASEKWVLNSAKSVEVNPKDFKLPEELENFTKVTKKGGIEKNQDFNQFLKAIEKKKASRFETFKEWLKEFLEN